MGLSQFPAPTLTAVATTYGASASPTAAISSNSFYASGASVTFTTTTANTKWLFEVDADIKWATGTTAIPVDCILVAQVDGGGYACSGGVGVASATGAASGYEMVELPIRGRLVLAIASIGAHTVVAGVSNGAGGNVTLKTIAVTATQLAG